MFNPYTYFKKKKISLDNILLKTRHLGDDKSICICMVLCYKCSVYWKLVHHAKIRDMWSADSNGIAFLLLYTDKEYVITKQIEKLTIYFVLLGLS